MSHKLSLQGTKQKIKGNMNLSISYYKISDKKDTNSLVDISMWTFLLSSLLNTSWNSRASLSSIQASFPTVSLSELFHEASSLVSQASFLNPDYTMLLCISVYLPMLCLLPGMDALNSFFTYQNLSIHKCPVQVLPS